MRRGDASLDLSLRLRVRVRLELGTRMLSDAVGLEQEQEEEEEKGLILVGQGRSIYPRRENRLFRGDRHRRVEGVLVLVLEVLEEEQEGVEVLRTMGSRRGSLCRGIRC